MSIAEIRINGDRVILDAAWHADLPPRAKAIDGKWNPGEKVWSFDMRDIDRVKELASDLWGWSEDEDEDLVDIKWEVSWSDMREAEVHEFGRMIMKRPGRDSPVRLGSGVILLEGKLPASGGSRANPAIGADDDIFVEVRDVPRALAERVDGVEILSAGPSAEDLRKKIAAREAELEELRAQLAAVEAGQ